MERMGKLYRKVLHVQESIEVTCIICSSRMGFELLSCNKMHAHAHTQQPSAKCMTLDMKIRTKQRNHTNSVPMHFIPTQQDFIQL